MSSTSGNGSEQQPPQQQLSQQQQQQQQATACTPQQQLQQHQQLVAAATTKVNLATTSLVSLCRSVIVAHFERYPPSAFCICSPDEFEELIKLRHDKTAPKKGSGGIDGTGRMAPAISEKWLHDVEQENEHLSDLTLTDELVWKDCVEYSFRRGGLTRPRGLTFPWPILIQNLQNAANVILNANSLETPAPDAQVKAACKTLVESPMNVELMQASGVGKTLKKALKKHQQHSSSLIYTQLDQLLNAWKDLAATCGVAMKDAPTPPKKKAAQDATASTAANASSPAVQPTYADDAVDLQLAQTCPSWRALFRALKEREANRRSDQSKRMREIRKNLASDRPKVVKVRPVQAKHSKILNGARSAGGGGGWGQAAAPVSKIDKLRKESTVMATRQKCTPAQALKTSNSSSFGAAVAFASVSTKKRGKNDSSNKTVQLAGGKRMKIPSKVVQGGGGQPRQMASKWKPMR